MAEILKCFNEAGIPEVKFTCVLVSKRINTKFFRGLENPHSGKISYYCSVLFNGLIILRNGCGQCCHAAREV